MASSSPNPMHVYGASGTFEACQIVTNSCGIDTLCQDITVMEAPTLFAVSGSIYREDLAAINNVELSCVNDDITDIAGEYLIEDIPIGSNCQLTPDKTDIARSGVSISDIIMIQRHLVFLDTLDSPYKIIAADVNGSGSVNITDLISIQRVILFIETEFPIGKTWRFIPESFNFPNPENPFATSFPEDISLNGISQDEVDQDFIGIKLGDVNNTADPINIQNDDPIYLIGNTNIDANILTIDFNSLSDVSLSGIQGRLNFDSQLLRPIISESKMTNLVDQYHEDAINFIWWDQASKKSGVKFSSDQSFYSMQFELLTNDHEAALNSIHLNNEFSMVVNSESHENKIQLDLKHREYSSNFFQNKIYPNPFSGKIFWSSENSERSIEWKLVDTKGKSISTGMLNNQSNAVLYDNPDLPAGVYFIEFLENGQKDVVRIIKL